MWIDQRGSEVLAAPECLRLVALAAKENLIGRLAINDGQTPLVAPLNFTLHDRQVLIRIGPGSLSETVPGSLVSFEVDRIDAKGNEAWSVLIRGLASAPDPTSSPQEAGVVPRPVVPIPGEIVLSIRPDVITGRRFRLLSPAEMTQS
jgi:nitroimidazol reductase NimA-like FMN-containing flavoprotein (pyridoxamine 5'-phosphate oxidase superfamily)